MSPALQAIAFADFAADPSWWCRQATWSPGEVQAIGANRLAATAVRLHDSGVVELPSDAVEHLRGVAFAASSRTVRIVRATGQALGALRERGIPFVLTKGPGIARCELRTLERPFDDLDVLIPPVHFADALGILGDLGYRQGPESSPPRAYFDRWCREAVNLRDGTGGSLDLHHHLPPWCWTREVDLGELVAGRSPYHFGGQTLDVASPLHNLLVVALHIFSDRNRAGATVRTWRDLLVLARVTDEAQVVDLFSRCGLLGWLRWLLEQYPRELRPAGLTAALADVEAVPPHRFRLRVLVPTGTRAGSHSIRYAFRLPVPHALLYLLGMAWPSRPFLALRFPDARHPVLQWWLSRERGAGSGALDSAGEPRPRGIASEEVHGSVTGGGEVPEPAVPSRGAGRAEERSSW